MIDKERIEKAVREILLAIGENPDREGLVETPRRVASMYEEIFAGMYRDPMDDAKVFLEEGAQELVVVRDIPLFSMCEHHLMPFQGVAHVVYIPGGSRILGLSKVARIVDTVSRRPQLQERLSSQVADVIEKACAPEGVLVVIKAEHLCMTMRGIKKPGAKTATITSRGRLKTDFNLRNEALRLIEME